MMTDPGEANFGVALWIATVLAAGSAVQSTTPVVAGRLRTRTWSWPACVYDHTIVAVPFARNAIPGAAMLVGPPPESGLESAEKVPVPGSSALAKSCPAPSASRQTASQWP